MAVEVSKVIFNPLEIKEEDMPVQVLAHQKGSWLGRLIQLRTFSEYSHSMIMVRPGYVVSQGFLVYKEIPLKVFMDKGYSMKFWAHTGLSVVERFQIISAIDCELKKAWWKKRYDFLGIFGQAIGLRWLNVPWAYYCSERDASFWRIILKAMPKRPSPEGIDSFFRGILSARVLGYWKKSC